MSNTRKSPKRTINVLVSNMLTQWNTRLERKHFQEILSSIDESLSDVRVNVFGGDEKTELSRVDSGKRVGLYDIYVWPYDIYSMAGYAKIFQRWKKSAQAEMINDAAKFVEAKQHIAIPTWTIEGDMNDNNSNIAVPYVPEGIYVVRPENGARSVGQLIIDTSKCELHHALGDYSTSWFESDHKPKPGVLPIPGNANGDGEPAAMLKDGYFVQRKVEKIDREFRVIIGITGEIEYIFSRLRAHTKANDMEYAHVSIERDLLVYNRLTGDTTEMARKALGVSENVYGEIVATLRRLDLHCNSVDLFTCFDSGHVSWGIFEFCNQFSISDWKSTDAIALLKNWYSYLLDGYLSEVKS